ncbi:MAG: hypothetical protein HY695_37645 [Deltaproteobacteria bacterium]|nr:hypothetical protein [Deltaproteobacteria bacterium]
MAHKIRFLMAFMFLIIPTAASLAVAQANRPFYEGKTIRLIVQTGTGTTSDIAARVVAPHWTRHIPGNPNIVVQNMAGAGGIVAANYLYNIAKPDGLTIATMGRANYLDQMVAKPEVKFDFRRFSWIGSFNRSPMMIACRTDSGYTTIESMRAAKSLPRFADGATGSIGFVFSELVAAALNLKFKQILGFVGGGRALDLAIERGEADCRATSDITVIRPPWPGWVGKRFVSFVVQQGPKKSRLLPEEVPTVYGVAPPEAKPVLTLLDIMLAYTEFDRPYAAPPGVAAEQLQILRESFEKMLHDPKFSADAKKIVDWDGSYLSGAQLQKKIEQTVTQPPEILKRVKEILE